MKNAANSNEFIHIQEEGPGFKTELDTIPNSPSKIFFSGQQRALIQSLGKKNQALAIIYSGGLWVLNDRSNPDRFSLCAHAIRELIEKLPEFLDVSTQAQTETLKAKVIEIEDSFLGMQQRTKCFNSTEGWNGTIDNHLQKFLLRLVEFLSWFANHHPRRREEFNKVLTRLEGSGRTLPTPLVSLNVDAWNKMRDYFQTIAHHRKNPTEGEFIQWLEALERFLLDRLVPRTFDDFTEIDVILEEASTNA